MTNNITHNLLDITYLDTLAAGDSWVHRLDPRAKLLVTLAFIAMVVSFGRYTISALVPFMLYPVVIISVGRIPVGYILKKVLLVTPLALMVGIFNPLIDRNICLSIGPLGLSGGWMSFISILLRFFLTVTVVLALISVTGLNALCDALRKLGVPRPFVVQLMFLYRYLFLLGEEAGRLDRARALRTFDRRAMGINVFGSLAGHLLIRTLARAERIYHAMLCRGFDGHVPVLRTSKMTLTDFIFILVWLLVFGFLRVFNLAQFLGRGLVGIWT